MLSRTADHLFWMARYIERAENTARLLDVAYQMSLLPQSDEQIENNWGSILSITELRPLFDMYYDALNARNVLEFMIWDTFNPSSIYSCLGSARENAHAVRGNLTTEVWEMNNATWLELRQMAKAHKKKNDDVSPFFEWVKFRSHLSRGVTIGTMLKDEAFYFHRIGTFLERADNTARILDVKYHAVAPLGRSGSASTSRVSAQNPHELSELPELRGSDPYHDFYHWNALLRSVSGFEIYRRVYRDVIVPSRVAELLILRADMPRSLAACLFEVVKNLEMVQNDQSAETQRQAGRLKAELEFGRVNEILDQGLHAYLTGFLERVNVLGESISKDFLIPV